MTQQRLPVPREIGRPASLPRLFLLAKRRATRYADTGWRPTGMSDIQYEAGIQAGQKWMTEFLEKNTRDESEELLKVTIEELTDKSELETRFRDGFIEGAQRALHGN